MNTSLLKDFVQKIHPLNEDELSAFCNDWQVHIVKRKAIITAAGETERYLYFVNKGVQRAFYLGDNNREATVVFTYPPCFSGVADSFLTQTPSLYFLEAITNSELLRISYEQLQELQQKHPGIRELIFKATAFALQGALHRHIELQCFTNEEKFRILLSRSPHVLNLIPHKYLASYLGMDATNFSKLVNTIHI